MIPGRLLIHTLTVITPGSSTDRYGTPSESWAAGDVTTRTIVGYVQPPNRTAAGGELLQAGRDAITYDQLVYTNSAVSGRERVVWEGVTYEVDGDPDVWNKPNGPGHVEVRLRAVGG